VKRSSDGAGSRGTHPDPEAPESLRATQRLVRALVTAPNGVEPALDGRPGVPGWLDDWPDPRGALGACVASDARLRSVDRLDVYAQAYFTRLHEVLLEDHPTVAWICGEAAFHDLVTGFLVAHPSRSPNLRDLGRPFADFLAGHPVAGFARARWPSLADVARLEWAFCDVFDAPDEAALTRDDLLALDPGEWASIALAPVAAFRRLAFDRGVGRFVRARRGAEPVPADEAAPETLVVWREDERAVFRAVDALEARALARVEAGTSFGELCVWSSAETGEAEAAAQAAAWLSGWVGAGWLKRLPREPELG
jgi:hypothetical protein